MVFVTGGSLVEPEPLDEVVELEDEDEEELLDEVVELEDEDEEELLDEVVELEDEDEEEPLDEVVELEEGIVLDAFEQPTINNDRNVDRIKVLLYFIKFPIFL